MTLTARPLLSRLWFNLAPTLPLVLALCAGCKLAAAPQALLARYEFVHPLMGVPFRLVFYAPDTNVAQRAAAAAFDRVRQLNSHLSDYEPDSELSRLSASAGSGRAVRLESDLWGLLRTSHRLYKRSHGAFDITVGPYVDLWKRARRQRELPSRAALERASHAVGCMFLRLDPSRRTAELLRPRMRLDLGGIAKGYAADAALRVLRHHGLRHALVAASGDIVCGDPPPGARGWRIELPDLPVPGSPKPEALLLANRAVSTSGDTEQRLDLDGRRYSHIIDPRSGQALTDHRLVLVVARDATTSDSLATALSVLATTEALRLARATPGVEARLLILGPGSPPAARETPGFPTLPRAQNLQPR
jgi:thiamine biosynthesis lipoprotein